MCIQMMIVLHTAGLENNSKKFMFLQKSQKIYLKNYLEYGEF